VRPGLFLLGASLLFAQLPDPDAGARLYRSTCANCHGLEGTNIVGVDLGHNSFKRASTDDDLTQIVINGIPGTGMPATGLPRPQAMNIVAYLRSMGAAAAIGGDINRGRALFASKGCGGCHRILGNGPRVWPDLSEIGSFRKPAELEQSILEPDAEIKPENRTFRAVSRDGATITGRVINEDKFTFQLLDSNEKLRSIEKANLREYSFSSKSAMPSLKGKLTTQEVADLVAYLNSLKRMDSK
jgi:putative heme-binding domain-containing protein